ncbi:MAG: ribbon-helix-helix domain-containing protein [Pikeienuella sp.]
MATFTRPAKRSLTLCGHRTSVTLEDTFWRQFQIIADEMKISVNALASRIDAARPSGVGLASAIRVYVLDATINRNNAAGLIDAA